VREMALVARLEIGFVPAAAFEAERGRGHESLQRRRATTRTLEQRIVADLLQRLELMSARLTTVLIERHQNLLRNRGIIPLALWPQPDIFSICTSASTKPSSTSSKTDPSPTRPPCCNGSPSAAIGSPSRRCRVTSRSCRS